MKRYYIAYGSNLNVRQMKMRCPKARVIGTAEIRNFELLFKESKTGSYLTVEPKDVGIVPVAVWETTEADESALDRYEGFPIFYYKAEMTLPVKELTDGKTRNRKCYIYIMHEDRPVGVPSRYYVQTCIEGYRSFGFDTDILKQAVQNSRRLYNEKRKYNQH